MILQHGSQITNCGESSLTVLRALSTFDVCHSVVLRVSEVSMKRSSVVVIAAALLNLAASVCAQQLNSINNMCNRFDHECKCSCCMLFK